MCRYASWRCPFKYTSYTIDWEGEITNTLISHYFKLTDIFQVYDYCGIGNWVKISPYSLYFSPYISIFSFSNRQDVSETIQIAALGKVKCQHQVRKLEDINE